MRLESMFSVLYTFEVKVFFRKQYVLITPKNNNKKNNTGSQRVYLNIVVNQSTQGSPHVLFFRLAPFILLV